MKDFKIFLIQIMTFNRKMYQSSVFMLHSWIITFNLKAWFARDEPIIPKETLLWSQPFPSTHVHLKAFSLLPAMLIFHTLITYHWAACSEAFSDLPSLIQLLLSSFISLNLLSIFSSKHLTLLPFVFLLSSLQYNLHKNNFVCFIYLSNSNIPWLINKYFYLINLCLSISFASQDSSVLKRIQDIFGMEIFGSLRSSSV